MIRVWYIRIFLRCFFDVNILRSKLIVSIFLISCSFEESIWAFVFFLKLLCRDINVWTRREIFCKSKEIRLRRESEFFWWVDNYLKLWLRCIQLLYVLYLSLRLICSISWFELIWKTIEIDWISLIDSLINVLKIILIEELLIELIISSELIVRIIWISSSIDQFSSNVLLVVQTLQKVLNLCE